MKRMKVLRGWHTAALAAILFLLGTSMTQARTFYYYPNGAYAAPMYYGGGYAAPVYGGGYSPAPSYYQAALTRPNMPSFDPSPATDYLSSVCQEGTYTWQADKMPIKIWIADGNGIPGYKPVFQDYIRRGFDQWCAISHDKLAWKEVSNPAQADITVRWTDHVTERPEGTEAGRTSAMTRLNTATGKGIIYGARMVFLTKLPTRYFADQEVEKTCLHEAGHALGLQGHSPYRNDIMYYAISPAQQPVLSERDVNTMNKLYADFPTLEEVAMRNKPHQAAGVIAR